MWHIYCQFVCLAEEIMCQQGETLSPPDQNWDLHQHRKASSLLISTPTPKESRTMKQNKLLILSDTYDY